MTNALRFLLDLEAALRASVDCDQVVATAVRLLGLHLATACAYVRVENDTGRADVVADHAGGVPALAPSFDLDDLDAPMAAALRGGRVHRTDTRSPATGAADRPSARTAATSILAIPLLDRGLLVAAMLLRAGGPRAWTGEEIDTARLVAHRCFEAVDRMRTMREAQEGSARVRLVADHVPAKISYVDGSLHYRFNNAAYADWYGVDTATIVGRHVREVLGEATFRERLPYMQRALLGETVAFKSPSEHRRLGMRMTDITCVPDVAADGEVRGFFVMSVDTTERQQAEERLRENDRRKDEFLAMLAHELRNPLAPLSNALYLWPAVAHDRKRTDELRAMMERQVRQLTRLLDDLLDVSRVSRGTIELRRRPVSLAESVDAAVEAVRLLADRQRQTLDVAPVPADLWLIADMARLTQVFGNVLNNAVKYTPEGGHIRLTVERDGEHVVVRVADDGRGIPRDMLERVFEMFVQVDPMLENPGGMGIGLALSKLLVEMHGGAIEARSAGPGRGTEIVVRLPLCPSADVTTVSSANPLVEDEAPVTGPVPPRRILVVDDIEASANMLAAVLRANGHDVRVALDGPSALEAAKRFRPDVVFLDLAMPGMNGFEVAQRLRTTREARDALLVALTGFAQEEDYRRTRAAGFDHHLVKPASMQRIEALLRETALPLA